MPNPCIFVGVDPGLDGAIAFVDQDGKFVEVHDAPTITVKSGRKNRRHYIESAMVTLLTKYDPYSRDKNFQGQKICVVGIENVHAMPGQGVTSMFSMGNGFGTWVGILAALRFPYEKIEPRAWKKELGLGVGADKNASVVLASRLFPRAPLARKKDHGRAEALLIAEHCRRKFMARGSGPEARPAAVA